MDKRHVQKALQACLFQQVSLIYASLLQQGALPSFDKVGVIEVHQALTVNALQSTNPTF